ncbi:uncharacterized protein LOC141683475 [Apium graveolens]|uniref:uncharacterized protein LOC141683475 n=1 Tax=Apium graveolens TaxID=4045 RepID=UPI003D7A8F37
MDHQLNEAYRGRLTALLRAMSVAKGVRDDDVPCQIEEGLFVGSIGAANNKSALRSLSITHILTVMSSTPPYPDEFKYKIVDVQDRHDVSISRYFDDCFDFIDEAKERGGKVLVHCFAGISRSVTVIVAYLIKKRGLRSSEALEHVKSKRAIASPNPGFLLQLQNFERSLRACEAINNLNKPKEGESGRQKRAKLSKDPRGKPDGPSFLKPHIPEVSLGDDVDPPIKGHAYRPNWGFRRGNTVVGSTKHAKDWSFHSITPQDYTEIVTGSDIESIEHLGSRAQASSNAFFQAALHQTKSWKDNSDEFEREMKKWKQMAEILEKKLKSKDEELSKAHSELVKIRSDKETLIDEYMDSQKFKDLRDIHDEGLFPIQFTQGWDAAVKAVMVKHPGLIEAKDFISPEQPKPEDSLDALFDSPMQEDRILDPSTTSPSASLAKNA